MGNLKVTFATNAILVNCEPIGGFVLKKDFEIKNNTSITQYLKIIDKEKPAQIGVNFNETSFGAINLGESHGGNKSMPIGTIISSPFKYETFLEVNHFKITENMSVAIWVPYDGRNVRSSHYGKFSGNVPDLRGLFLRNVNDYNVPFDGVGKVKDNQANPENTSAGVVQEDIFKSHDHSLNNAQINAGGAPGPDGNNYRAYGTTKTGSNGGNETRPKNMTVYYYIKIN